MPSIAEVTLDQEKMEIEASFYPDILDTLNSIYDDLEIVLSVNPDLNIAEFLEKEGVALRAVLISLYRTTIDEVGKPLSQESNIFDKNTNYEKELSQIDNTLAELSILFLLDTSTSQVQHIVDNIGKEVSKNKLLARNQHIRILLDLDAELQQAQESLFLGIGTLQDVRDIEDRINNLSSFPTGILAGLVIDKLRRSIESRAKLIVEYNVGLAESWARDTEADLFKAAILAGTLTVEGLKPELIEEWVTMHDSRVRNSHVIADGQIKVNGTFTVMGEQLKYPRDTNGSLPNILGCRCTIRRQFKLG